MPPPALPLPPATSGWPGGKLAGGTPAVVGCIAVEGALIALWLTELANIKPIIKPASSPIIPNKTFSLFISLLRVRVQTRQKVADPQVRKDHKQKSDDREISGTTSLP